MFCRVCMLISSVYFMFYFIQGVKKQLLAKSKMKDCEAIGLWKKAIINHLYWAASSTPSGKGELMAAKFRSFVNHVVNKHEGHNEHEEFTRCVHSEDIQPRQWMKEGNICIPFRLCAMFLEMSTSCQGWLFLI